MSFGLCKNCSKIQELENRRDLYTPGLGPFNYHIKGKSKCLYQFLIKLTLSISTFSLFYEKFPVLHTIQFGENIYLRDEYQYFNRELYLVLHLIQTV